MDSRAAGLGAPNYLKLVIDGKRNLSREMAARFAVACRLNAESTEYFELLVAFDQAESDAERNVLHERLSRFARFRSSQRLDVAQHEYHSSWFIPAIRELVSCPGFVDDPQAGLAGLEFLLESAEGYVPVAGSVVRVSFEDTELGLSTGCNGMYGAWSPCDGRLCVNEGAQQHRNRLRARARRAGRVVQRLLHLVAARDPVGRSSGRAGAWIRSSRVMARRGSRVRTRS